MKKTICRVCSVCILIMMLFLTSCGGGFFAEEELVIASIESEVMYDGSTKITITYADEEVEPDVFYIPRGEDGLIGAVGNGIKEFVCERDEDGRLTTVTVTFTDESMPQAKFEVPDGLSVIGINDDIDTDSGQRYIEFKYSDGTLSAPIYLPSGKDGIGIDDLQVTVNEDKTATMYIKFSDGSEKFLPIPAPEEGVGVLSMVGIEEGQYYYIDIEYTNGETAQIQFERSAKWYSGAFIPQSSLGENGDYFFDTEHEKIYTKISGEWDVVVDFKIEKYRVMFDLNDDGDASMPTASSIFRVERGAYFSADGNGDIPIPTRAGYVFKGWYTKRVVNTATMSPFTDFTPVFSDLTLYAIWEEIA